MRLENQTFRNYNELYDLILNCYKDYSMLKAYEELQNDNNELYCTAQNISNHVILLLQKDLSLTLWKIYYDISQNANTIPKFRNTINRLLHDNGKENNYVKKAKIDKTFENKLKKMRHEFLAHTDMCRDASRIEIQDFKNSLDEMCKEILFAT